MTVQFDSRTLYLITAPGSSCHVADLGVDVRTGEAEDGRVQ
ncbi:hypothetical protein [Nocardia mikamii]|nr:hypothetical protein [Nocardia mikamii]